MGMIINDGTGTGFRAKVDLNNRMHTLAVSETIEHIRAVAGDGYLAGTPVINLTSGTISALFYLLNNEDEDVVATSLIGNFGNSTGGAGDLSIVATLNPTGGTLITAGVATPPINKNFGSSKTLDVTSLVGAEGSTITGGTPIAQIPFAQVGRISLEVGDLIIPRGAALALSIIPQTGNTDMNVTITSGIYLDIK